MATLEKIIQSPPSLDRLKHIDSLRAIATLLVILDHVFLTSYHFDHIPRSPWGSHTYWFLFGHYGVALFIILSGFCLMLPVLANDGYLRGSFREFMRRRAWRILPPYYLSMAVCLILGATIIHPIGRVWDTLGHTTPVGFILHIFLLHHLTRSAWAEINGVYWSLGVEWWIYVLFPLLLRGWRRIGALATLTATVIIGTAIYLPIHTLLPRACPQFIALFAVGMWAADISYGASWAKIRNSLPWNWLAVFGLAILLAVYGHANPIRLDEATGDLVMALFAFPLLIASSKPGVWQSALNAKPLVIIGSFSYSIYLMHLPLLALFWQQFINPHYYLLRNDKAVILLLFLGVPTVTAGCFLFYLICERPFLHRRSWRSWGIGQKQPGSKPVH